MSVDPRAQVPDEGACGFDRHRKTRQVISLS